MVFAAWIAFAATAAAQPSDVHYRFDGYAPPGAIGSWQLQRGGPLPGYFQPVEIAAPSGTLIALAVDGAFGQPQPTPLNVGMLIAPVYRLRVTNIPNEPGRELFPTVEVIDRLYPPVGQHRRFPIPIELTDEDLRLALEGKFVTRVIYLEDPESAIPFPADPIHQEWYEVGPNRNPLAEADRLGRPMAILRIGSRLPDDRAGPDMQFLGGCPPYTFFQQYEMEEAPADAQLTAPAGTAVSAAAPAAPSDVEPYVPASSGWPAQGAQP